jgi:hypothetical protein
MSVGIVVLIDKLVNPNPANFRPTGKQIADFHKVDPKDLETEIRTKLQPETERAAVEQYLKNKGIEYSFNQTNNIIYAVARKLDGSGLLARVDETFEFHLDGSARLKWIESKVYLTGL